VKDYVIEYIKFPSYPTKKLPEREIPSIAKQQYSNHSKHPSIYAWVFTFTYSLLSPTTPQFSFTHWYNVSI